VYRAIPQLSRAECDEFLVRLAQGEINLSTKFNRRLRELAGKRPPVPTSRRTISQLLTAAEEQAERERERQAAEAEAKRLKALQALAQRETQAWQEVDSLVQEGQAKPYDEAVQLIGHLWELAVHQEHEIVFRVRLGQIYGQYSRRSALMRRLRGAGFPK
jgi:Skp family chaperone for outer membrane proteins